MRCQSLCAILTFGGLKPSRGLRHGSFFFSLVLSVIASTASGDDWPQWMGPTRDGEYRETGLLDSFPSSGLKVLWRQPAGGGYAGPAVAGGKVVLMDYQISSGEIKNDPGARTELDGEERIVCFDQSSGKVLWTHSYSCPYSISYPAGPRCTPSIFGEDVITLGSQGDLKCLSLVDGEVRWSVNFAKDLSAPVPIWGFSAHPLVTDTQVICMVGGDQQTVVAFDRQQGRVLWKSGNASAVGYCPPSLIEAGGVTQLIVWHADGIEALNPANGDNYWTVPLKPQYEMAIARPQRDGDYLFASAIGSQSALLKLSADAPSVKEVWYGTAKDSVYCANSTPIFYRGTIYGADCQVGVFRAVSADDGQRLWESFEPTRQGEQRRISHGTAFVTHLAGTDRYLLFSELGDLILAELSPDGYREISRAHVIEPTSEAFGRSVVWSHPAYAGRAAFVRNDKEIIAVSLTDSN